MPGLAILTSMARLTLSTISNQVQRKTIMTHSAPLLFRTTPLLFAEPLKKKKRLDPQILKAREDRKKKKLEKQIRRLERNARQMKPIDELEVPLYLIDNKQLHQRVSPTLSTQTLESRAILEKSWAAYKRNQHLADVQMLDRILQSQQKALDELRKESEELYQEAIQLDLSLLPFQSKGPVFSPPSQTYESPDGEYIDISKKWD